MTSPTTPRDAIGLSERLRDRSQSKFTPYDDRIVMAEAAAQIDALSARVKEDANRTANLISIIADIREKSGLGGRPMLNELAAAIEAKLTAAESRATCAEQEQTALIRDYQRVNSQLAAEMKRATRAEQERDEALERAAKVAESPDIWKKFDGDFEGNCIAAAIRSLAAGPDKEKR